MGPGPGDSAAAAWGRGAVRARGWGLQLSAPRRPAPGLGFRLTAQPDRLHTPRPARVDEAGILPCHGGGYFRPPPPCARRTARPAPAGQALDAEARARVGGVEGGIGDGCGRGGFCCTLAGPGVTGSPARQSRQSGTVRSGGGVPGRASESRRGDVAGGAGGGAWRRRGR